jgi:hypothetical protein
MPERLYATINPRGDFVVNLKTYIRMNEPEAVVLLYDRDTRTIGVRPSRLTVPNAILVTPGTRDITAYFARENSSPNTASRSKRQCSSRPPRSTPTAS